MLVLSRHCDESLTIFTTDGPITITVVDIRGDRTRLGVDAPRHIEVHREEVVKVLEAERGPRWWERNGGVA